MKLETGNGKADECRDRCRAGFTLVEMLVVIVIILVLIGVVFKMTRPAVGKQAEAETVARLERLKAAMEEFYAEYGHYPPVPYYAGGQPLRYEYPWNQGMRSDMIGKFGDQTWDTAPLFTFGLMSFLLPRSAGRAGGAWDALLDNDQWDAYNDQKGDLTRDTRACERWWPFLDGILADDQLTVNFLAGKKSDAYTNLSVSVWDGWERDLVYVSPPPHQSYLLFSMGPDGTYDSKEPDNRDSPANKDNIYGDVGFVQR